MTQNYKTEIIIIIILMIPNYNNGIYINQTNKTPIIIIETIIIKIIIT